MPRPAAGLPDSLCAVIVASSGKRLPGEEWIRRILRCGKPQIPIFSPQKGAESVDPMNIIEKILPGTNRVKLAQERRELLDRLASANEVYQTTNFPKVRRELDAALEAGLWPRNKFATPEMAAANVALIKLVDASCSRGQTSIFSGASP
jgi:hypothetical protein